MDSNSIKIYTKWVKSCKKLGLSYAKMGDYEYSAAEKPIKSAKLKKKSETIEGLTHDESAKMPSDSEMLMYSTEYFDQLRNSRKDPTPRN